MSSAASGIGKLAALLLCLLLLAHARSAHAQRRHPAPLEDFDHAAETYSEFWEQVLAADKEGYRNLLARAAGLWAEGGARAQDLAFRQLMSASAAHPEDPEAHYWIGLYASQIADWDRCAKHLSIAYQMEPGFAIVPPPKNGDLRKNYARCLLYLGEFAEAAQHLEQLASLGRGDSTTTLQLAESYMALGRLEDTIRVIVQRPVSRSHRQDANYILAVAYDRQEKVAESRSALGTAMRRDGNLVSLQRAERFFAPSFDLHYYLGLGYERQHRFAQSIYHFRRFLKEGGATSPWRRRSNQHIAEMLERPFAEKLDLSGGAEWPADQLRSKIRVHEDALERCVEGHPRVIVEVQLTKVVGGLTSVNAVSEIHDSISHEEHEKIIACAEAAARKIALPKAVGPSGSHVSAQWRWISRESQPAK